MAQKTLVLVIGRNAAGKSTLVRSVSGAGRTTWHRTEDKATEQAIYSWSQSLQEAHVEEDVLLERLQQVAGDKEAGGVVLASRPTGDGHLALDRLVLLGGALGFRVVAALLDPPWSGRAGTLAATRVELAALDVPVTTLDGRRFPALNAQIVMRLLLGEVA